MLARGAACVDELENCIRAALPAAQPPKGVKIGNQLQRQVGALLATRGFVVDVGDTRCFLKRGMPVWRSKHSGEIAPSAARRIIDLVIYSASGDLLALIETESDLDDLRLSGVTQRNGNYDVFSIARNYQGGHFNSYNSLERMAAAVSYRHSEITGRIDNFVDILSNIASDSPGDHNPLDVGIFLVTGRYRPQDPAILEPRLKSLNARLIAPPPR